jgi:integral membrane protein
MKGALRRYQVLAYLVGIGLLVLTLVGVPLQYAAGHPGVVAVVGPIHGFLYIVYLATAYDLARRARFGFWRMAAMVCAGFLPFLAFVVEHRIASQLQQAPELAGD